VPWWAVAAAVVAALVPATVLGAQRIFDSAAAPASHATDLPIPPVSPRTTPPTTPPSTPPSTPPTSGPSATAPTPPPAELPRIAPDAPRRITSGDAIDAGFDNAVTDLDAASTSEVARWEGRGSPGSPGTDTVYVIGKVLGGDSGFAGLPRLEPGATVSIRTDSGTLTYQVEATTLRTEDGLEDDPLFTGHEAGRLVLVGIRYDDSGDRLDKALVVTAQLSAAEPS
jgi:hypothetical protein